MVFSLKEAGNCDTKITGKAGTGNGRAASFDYTQLRECAASEVLGNARKDRLRPH
jgi:hypothetical protein